MMKKFLNLSLRVFLMHISFLAQSQERITVKAGTSLLDYFTFEERYLYPEFRNGRILFKANTYTERKLNYNFLVGEIEFIEKSDTLSIINMEDINLITVDQDSFYYNKGYLRQIKSEYPKVAVKELYDLKEIRKQDPYGVASSGGSSTSYSSLPADGNFHKLKANRDMIFERTRLYYISASENIYLNYIKKNVFKLYPMYKKKIKSYLKMNKIKFDSEEDLSKLAEYLESL